MRTLRITITGVRLSACMPMTPYDTEARSIRSKESIGKKGRTAAGGIHDYCCDWQCLQDSRPAFVENLRGTLGLGHWSEGELASCEGGVHDRKACCVLRRVVRLMTTR